MLPFYLFGNIHCFGMCGPLVMMIGQHRYRSLYFAGRMLSFALAGMLAGELGAVLNVFLMRYHLSEATCFIFGGFIFYIGLKSFFKWQIRPLKWLSGPLAKLNRSLSLLMLQDTGLSTFLFGFFTVFLPCGQSLVVFSACALAADAYVGLLNGFGLALLTTPALAFAMQMQNLLKKYKNHYNTILGVCSIIIGALAFCRGFAELGWIPHLILNPNAPTHYHIIIF